MRAGGGSRADASREGDLDRGGERTGERTGERVGDFGIALIVGRRRSSEMTIGGGSLCQSRVKKSPLRAASCKWILTWSDMVWRSAFVRQRMKARSTHMRTEAGQRCGLGVSTRASAAARSSAVRVSAAPPAALDAWPPFMAFRRERRSAMAEAELDAERVL